MVTCNHIVAELHRIVAAPPSETGAAAAAPAERESPRRDSAFEGPQRPAHEPCAASTSGAEDWSGFRPALAAIVSTAASPGPARLDPTPTPLLHGWADSGPADKAWSPDARRGEAVTPPGHIRARDAAFAAQGGSSSGAATPLTDGGGRLAALESVFLEAQRRLAAVVGVLADVVALPRVTLAGLAAAELAPFETALRQACHTFHTYTPLFAREVSSRAKSLRSPRPGGLSMSATLCHVCWHVASLPRDNLCPWRGASFPHCARSCAGPSRARCSATRRSARGAEARPCDGLRRCTGPPYVRGSVSCRRERGAAGRPGRRARRACAACRRVRVPAALSRVGMRRRSGGARRGRACRPARAHRGPRGTPRCRALLLAPRHLPLASLRGRCR